MGKKDYNDYNGYKTNESLSRWHLSSMEQQKLLYIWGFPKIVVPQNGWCMMETPIKMDDLGVPPFKMLKETPISTRCDTLKFEHFLLVPKSGTH